MVCAGGASVMKLGSFAGDGWPVGAAPMKQMAQQEELPTRPLNALKD